MDFYLPDYNIAIECQGEQHFFDCGSYFNFTKTKELDEKKYFLCKENNINLFYFFNKEYVKYIKDFIIYDKNFFNNKKIFLNELRKTL